MSEQTSHLQRVNHWLATLASEPTPTMTCGLSAPGFEAVWRIALQAISPQALTHAVHMPGTPFQRACIVAASTVCTAPLEWIAVLLARGTQVTVKHGTETPGLCSYLVQSAQAFDLPLCATCDRDAAHHADLVVAMGSDETIDTLRTTLPNRTHFLGFGHRFSVAWISKKHPHEEALWQKLALDIALHDGRGCMSPTVVFTDVDSQNAMGQLLTAMRQQALRLPRGRISDREAIALRARSSLAKIVGTTQEQGDAVVHLLPETHLQWTGLPGAITLCPVDSASHASRLLQPVARWLSTVGSNDPSTTPWPALGNVRLCAPGQMQQPPLVRLHDGVDWLHETMDGS